MARLDDRAIRLELLRTRAALDRAALHAAVAELRASTASVRAVIGLVAGRGNKGDAAGAGIGMLVRAVVGVLRERPWLLSAAATVVGRRGLRRWLVLGAVTVVIAVVVRRMVTPGPAAPRPDGATGA